MVPRARAGLRLLTPAILLPVQVVPPAADRWLRRLCRAILEDALACLDGKGPPSNMGSDRDGARRACQAWQWFESEATYFFSFTLICAVLDLDVEAVRRQVRQRVRQEPPGRHREMGEKVEETAAAVRETFARAHAAFDQTRQRLHELDEARQLHRAIAERKAELHPHSCSAQLPRSTPHASDAPPQPVPAAESPTTNEAE